MSQNDFFSNRSETTAIISEQIQGERRGSDTLTMALCPWHRQPGGQLSLVVIIILSELYPDMHWSRPLALYQLSWVHRKKSWSLHLALWGGTNTEGPIVLGVCGYVCGLEHCHGGRHASKYSLLCSEADKCDLLPLYSLTVSLLTASLQTRKKIHSFTWKHVTLKTWAVFKHNSHI